MHFRVTAAGLTIALGLAALAVPALAQPKSNISAQEKMKTCEFGADDQKLTGAARRDFIKKCMANEDAPAKTKKK